LVFSPHSLAFFSAFTRAGHTVGAAVTLFGFVHAIWQQNRTKPSVRIVPVLPPPAAAKRKDRQRPKKHAPERKTAVQISSKGGKKSQVVVAVLLLKKKERERAREGAARVCVCLRVSLSNAQ